MAKSLLKLTARELRLNGMSIRDITSKLGVSKSSVSVWCRDIILTDKQVKELMKNQKNKGLPGRLKGASIQRQRRLDQVEKLRKAGVETLKIIDKNSLFFTGLGLYWGEGEKSYQRMSFCNSDPSLIKFMIVWLDKCFGIPLSNLRFQVGINIIYRSDIERINHFWYKVTGATSEQFVKPSFKKTTNKKVYSNPEAHFGTLRVAVRTPSRYQRKVLGLIEGLKQTRIIT